MPVNVLALLTRLRQLALHPGLIPRNYLEELRTMVSGADAPPAPAIPITPQDRIRLQMVLARAIEDSEECPICFEICEFRHNGMFVLSEGTNLTVSK